MLRQGSDVFASFAQGGQVNLKDIQTKKQVGAKAAVGDFPP